MSDEGGDPRIALVILTHQRRELALRAIERALALPERPEIVVVDNGSRDGTADAIERRGAPVRLVRSRRNLGAAGRNLGLCATRRPFVAFSDDDVWWEPGALARAAEVLDAHAQVAIVTASVLVGSEARLDPTCRTMAASPLPSEPAGHALVGFLAGACIARRSAFLAAGGYEARLHIGGEEALLAWDLLAAGWRILYVPEVVAHHEPSALRDSARRRHLLLRNAALIAWLRRPSGRAWAVTGEAWREAGGPTARLRLAISLLRQAPWLWRERRVLPPEAEAEIALVEAALSGSRKPADGAARGIASSGAT